jgi:hypothetical protein
MERHHLGELGVGGKIYKNGSSIIGMGRLE